MLAPGESQSCWDSWPLFRFTAICGLVPLYALFTVCRGWKGPSGPTGTHPQSLETSALGANADVAATPCNQCGLLCQSVGKGFRESGAPAQLPVAEADSGGPGPSLLQGKGPRPEHRSCPPAPHLQAVTTQDDPLELPQHLLTH